MAEGQGRSSKQGVKLLFVRDYMRSNTDKNNVRNATQIQKYLASNGITASLKTIYNDLLLLQYDFGEPIAYNAKMRGYHITEPQFEPSELRLMVDSVQGAKFITQKEADRITEKIKGLADIYTKGSLNRPAYIRGRGENEHAIEITGYIYQAIKENKQISFCYFKYNPDKSKNYNRKGNRYIVSPYALHWENGKYYLYGYDHKDQKFKSFRIDRMDQVGLPLALAREGKDQYDRRNLTSTQKPKVFSEYHGDLYKVRMRFSNHQANAVIDEFGKDVMLIPDDKDHFTFTADIEVSPPFFAWVATFGRMAQITGPEPVVEEMRKFLQKSMDMYKDEGEK